MSDSMKRQLEERRARLAQRARNAVNNENQNQNQNQNYHAPPQSQSQYAHESYQPQQPPQYTSHNHNPFQSMHHSNTNSNPNVPQSQNLSSRQTHTQVTQPQAQQQASHHMGNDYELARLLQSRFDMEDDSHNNSAPIQQQQPSQSVEQQHEPSQRVGIDADHEAALHLQRMYEQQDSRRQQQQQQRHQNQPQQPFPWSRPFPSIPQQPQQQPQQPQANNGWNYSWSSSSNPNSGSSQTVVSTHTDANGHTVRTVTTNNNRQPDPNNPFSHPFFAQGMPGMNGMPGMQGMQGMQGMHGMPPDMMMMMGGGGQQFMMGDLMHMMQPRPRVANRLNVEALPTDTFRAKKKEESKEGNGVESAMSGDGEEEDEEGRESCSICLETFHEGDEIRRLPCLHIFHKNEIDRWLLTGADKCPICRVPINGQMHNQ